MVEWDLVLKVHRYHLGSLTESWFASADLSDLEIVCQLMSGMKSLMEFLCGLLTRFDLQMVCQLMIVKDL